MQLTRFLTWLPLCLILMLTGCAQQDINLFGPGRKISSNNVPPSVAKGNRGPLAGAVAPTADGTMKVGLLLPLSGTHAALGQAMLNAAQMAVFDSGAKNLELLPRDTGDAGPAAVAAMRDAATVGARLMIGPVFAPQVSAVRTAVTGTGLNVLALSNDATLAMPGVYIVGFTPAAQVVRVVSHAMAHGAVRFAALIPLGPYGDIVAAALNDTLARHHGVGARIGRYASNGIDLNQVMQEVASERGQLDALLIADGGANLQRIAKALPHYRLNDPRIRLLGTGLWDEGNLGRRVPQLVGGWYAAPALKDRTEFYTRYQEIYGAPPPRLATLSYDATALAGVLAQRGGRADAGTLTNPAGFVGMDGIFRFSADGVAERGLAVHQVQDDGVLALDPAPQTFVREGN